MAQTSPPTTARLFRQSRGLRLSDVAKATGIQIASLSRFERGIGGLAKANEARLAAYLGVPTAALSVPMAGAGAE